MFDILSSIGSEISSVFVGYILSKVFDFFYPDAMTAYTTALCVDKPIEICATSKLPQIYEEDAVGTSPGYKNYKYGVIDGSDWIISIPEEAVDKRTRIHIYTTISTKPVSGYHYFHYKIRYKNTDEPDITTFCKRYYLGDYIHPIHSPDKTKKINLKKNIIIGSYFFKSKIDESHNGKDIGTEQIGLTFGGGSGEYIIEEAYISDKHINIKKCGCCTYIFWRCYTRKPKYIKEP